MKIREKKNSFSLLPEGLLLVALCLCFSPRVSRYSSKMRWKNMEQWRAADGSHRQTTSRRHWNMFSKSLNNILNWTRHFFVTLITEVSLLNSAPTEGSSSAALTDVNLKVLANVLNPNTLRGIAPEEGKDISASTWKRTRVKVNKQAVLGGVGVARHNSITAKVDECRRSNTPGRVQLSCGLKCRRTQSCQNVPLQISATEVGHVPIQISLLESFWYEAAKVGDFPYVMFCLISDYFDDLIKEC